MGHMPPTTTRHPPLYTAIGAVVAGHRHRTSDPGILRRETHGVPAIDGFYGSASRVASVMIEVRRSLHMGEATGERGAGFGTVGGAITAAVRSALASAQGPH